MMESLKKKYSSKQENSFSKLLELRTQIKSFSSSKELCKIIFFYLCSY